MAKFSELIKLSEAKSVTRCKNKHRYFNKAEEKRRGGGREGGRRRMIERKAKEGERE
jgi:hypothetical protein